MKRFVVLAIAIAVTVSCSASTGAGKSYDSIRWVLTAAEFEALCLQAYRGASEFLQPALSDTAWSALPGQTDAGKLPPAIIFDVDETLLSNAEFQASYTPPFTNAKLEDWSRSTVAKALPGSIDFVRLARHAGVELFFVTNRPCEATPGIDDACPQEGVTIADLVEAGIDADADHVLLANERPDWDREKLVRRNYIAKTHRVIMLIGDDLGDFIECTRSSPRHPCTQRATMESRGAATMDYRRYWGAGWFILPNPMHGSWTTVE
jgi:acid phosphatase